MDAERAQTALAGAAESTEPIDTATIRDTIRLVMRLSSGPLDLVTLADHHEALRGHVHLLLPGVQDAADRMWRGGSSWYQQAARLDNVTWQAGQELASDPFAAMVQVQLLARDTEWLVDQQAGLPGGTPQVHPTAGSV
ncbi:DUF6415 family natural product biosynthesis protein [Streptomyces sp. NPDC015125]|uniref:DUF6415 family natural product biosynthesis protein n=1 Tax=Streptomyces sp. NPDC015125 TaxID=3364938 RepID=UPI0036FC4137